MEVGILICDKEDKWIQIFKQKEDMLTLLTGIYHHFPLDNKNHVLFF